jgi:hypothetical protein
MPVASVYVLGRVLVGLLLILAGVAKLRERSAFTKTVADLQVLPSTSSRVVGTVLPPVEIVTGTLMLMGWEARVMSIVSAILFIAFALFLTLALRRASGAQCGCFGRGGKISPALVLRNLGLALLALGSGVLPLAGLFTSALLLICLGTLPALRRPLVTG